MKHAINSSSDLNGQQSNQQSSEQSSQQAEHLIQRRTLLKAGAGALVVGFSAASTLAHAAAPTSAPALRPRCARPNRSPKTWSILL